MQRSFAAAVALAILLGGCTNGALWRGPQGADAEPVIDREVLDARLVAQHLDLMQRLMLAGPAQQAEIAAAARLGFDEAPTPSNQLRYALVLATPGHPSTDAAEARRLLGALLAMPETLMPAERALAQVELAQAEVAATAADEIARLQSGAVQAERERVAAANRRLQTEIETNARLKRELEDARAKLDAIATIERSITERKTTNEGRNP